MPGRIYLDATILRAWAAELRDYRGVRVEKLRDYIQRLVVASPVVQFRLGAVAVEFEYYVRQYTQLSVAFIDLENQIIRLAQAVEAATGSVSARPSWVQTVFRPPVATAAATVSIGVWYRQPRFVINIGRFLRGRTVATVVTPASTRWQLVNPRSVQRWA